MMGLFFLDDVEQSSDGEQERERERKRDTNDRGCVQG